MKRWTMIGLAGAAMSVAACASILGIEDGILDTEAGADSVDSGPPVCISDGGDPPNSSNNVFVAANGIGKDSPTCGDEITPCATFKTALSRLHTLGGSIVYATNGTYAETISLVAGAEIQGGWTIKGTGENTQWEHVCNPADPTEATIVTGAGPITIQANDINGEGKLTNLSIATKAPVAGESVYGIFASGSTTKLTLDNVSVVAGPGGNGAAGSDGDAGAAGFGTCSLGTGQTPEAGTAGDPAGVGTVSATGITAPPASLGLLGTTGESGGAGADGGCETCIKCTGTIVLCDSSNAATPTCGGRGSSGCGGVGGFGGKPGQTGGSSVGIYLWGGAVVLNGGVVHAGKAGNGGSGGNGGPGGIGSVGSTGPDGGSCNVACNAVLCTGTTGWGPGGMGSLGGMGSNGGAGGGGAGGDSFGIVSGLDASVKVQASADIKAGTAGNAGAPNGPLGVSKDRYP